VKSSDFGGKDKNPKEKFPLPFGERARVRGKVKDKNSDEAKFKLKITQNKTTSI